MGKGRFARIFSPTGAFIVFAIPDTVEQGFEYTLTGRAFFIPSSIMNIGFTPVFQSSCFLPSMKPSGGERKK